MLSPSGLLVAVEGGEGAGKSSMAAHLADWFTARGQQVLRTHEPGDSPLGRALRQLVLEPGLTMSARAEALLFATDRAEHVARVVWPALQAGQVVVTDRYVDSSLAYQGAGAGLEVSEVEQVSRWATSGLEADLTVLLDVPVEVGLARVAHPADRIEARSREFHERVRTAFLRLAARAPQRYLVIDASRPLAQVWTDTEAALTGWWAAHGEHGVKEVPGVKEVKEPEKSAESEESAR